MVSLLSLYKTMRWWLISCYLLGCCQGSLSSRALVTIWPHNIKDKRRWKSESPNDDFIFLIVAKTQDIFESITGLVCFSSWNFSRSFLLQSSNALTVYFSIFCGVFTADLRKLWYVCVDCWSNTPSILFSFRILSFTTQKQLTSRISL